MNFTPTELSRLAIFTAAELARRYRSEGIRLSHCEAVALICDEVLTAARKGMKQPDLVEYGRSLLTIDDVEPGVASMMPSLTVEACVAQGTQLVTVFEPIQSGQMKIEHTAVAAEAADHEPILGEIGIDAECERVSVDVLNTGDRAIQVRSLAHFFDVHRALKFDRSTAFGMRLDRPSGDAIRFEPGEITHVELVRMVAPAGERAFGRSAEVAGHAGEVKQRGLRLARG